MLECNRTMSRLSGSVVVLINPVGLGVHRVFLFGQRRSPLPSDRQQQAYDPNDNQKDFACSSNCCSIHGHASNLSKAARVAKHRPVIVANEIIARDRRGTFGQSVSVANRFGKPTPLLESLLYGEHFSKKIVVCSLQNSI